MKFLPSPFGKFSFMDRFALSVFVVTAISVLLILLSGFLVDSNLPGRIRIFPFLVILATTLGLAILLDLINVIISHHQGDIMVGSSPGSGSSFTIKLPKSDLAEKKKTSDKFECKGEEALVLVIEDEKNVREVLDAILSAGGHKVTHATTGEEGIQFFKNQKPDIVITDLGMPGLSGWDVADRIKAFDPFTPVILSTGWGVKPDENYVHKQNVDRIISKPFKMEQILNLISELLAQRKTQSVNA